MVGQRVAHLAGAWIEISDSEVIPSPSSVAHLAGAWIEIHILLLTPYGSGSRSPRGSVD